LFHSYNSQPIPYGVHSASNRIHPSLSYIIYVITWCSYLYTHYMFTLTTLLTYEMNIWLKRGSCRKSKAGQSELGLCKLKLYVVSFRNLCVICYIGLFCIFFVSLPHNDISVFSNMCISSLLVLNGWRRRRHGILYFRIFSMYTLKFVCEKFPFV
jgi:hypothetical protein